MHFIGILLDQQHQLQRHPSSACLFDSTVAACYKSFPHESFRELSMKKALSL